MQYTTLFTLLTLLATPSLTLAKPHHHAPKRHAAQHVKHITREQEIAHERNIADITAEIYRRDELAAQFSQQRALAEAPSRKVKKRAGTAGAGGCRVKGSTFTASSASTSVAGTTTMTSMVVVTPTSSSTTTAATTTTTSSVGNNVAAVQYGNGGGQVTQSETSTTAWSTQSSTAAPAASSAAAPAGGNSVSVSGTPNGIKAGGAGSDTLAAYGSHTSWWFNYGPDADGSGSQVFIPMLWGDGSQGGQDWDRLEAFKAISSAPSYIFGFYEPDCYAPMSSDIDPTVAAPIWNSLIVPWRAQGTALISPGMCKQKDETWLQPFRNAIGDANMWDYTQIHTNKNTLEGVQEDVEYYYNTYGKPVWVNEFACVDDQNGFVPCTDQGEINDFINQVVAFFEGDYRVVAYAMSEGEGLGSVWPPYANGALTESGQTYLNAISQYH